MATKRQPVPEKTGGGLEKDSQTCGEGRKSRKRLTLVVGNKPNGKSQFAANKSPYLADPEAKSVA
jgi:hypothetical protein